MMTSKYEIKYLIEAQKAALATDETKKKLVETNRLQAQIMLRKILDSQVSSVSSGSIDIDRY